MKSTYFKLIVLATSMLFISCKKFLEIDPPKNSLIQETVFSNNDVATSTVTGIYSVMAASGYASGGASSITALAGLSADELVGYSTALKEFYQNQLTATTSNIATPLYGTAYKNIYTANLVLEGLETADKVSLPVKAQLRGEAFFIRAFAYFNLVNLYGPVPLQLTSDYRITSIGKRVPVNAIYRQIITDLQSAESLLTDTYITTERVRPNLAAVQAMLARVYLFTEDWVNAEKYASLVINKRSQYSLVALDAIFLKNSLEAIWQLFPSANTNASDGGLFILTGTPTNLSLSNSFVSNAFEPNDKRKSSWIKSLTNTTGTYYYPFKYKTRSSTTPVEYTMVLRLAEQYLIRAEARAKLDNLSGAIEDLDVIRSRGGITLLKVTNPTINKQDLINSIYQERRVELFSEWGHRWFDLKRSNNADGVLKLVKTNWQTTDLLYPIPQTELIQNKNIEQNPGY